ncbi:MAG: septum formation initiator family protein [Acidimicrobiia bacterium]|nr:septum formation initiator family protein [Acidimicrobiia bacterium]
MLVQHCSIFFMRTSSPSTDDTPTGIPQAAPTRPRDRRRPRSGPEVRERRRRLIRYAVWVVSGVLMVNALVGEKGYLATLQARQEQERAEASLYRLRAENARLQHEAERLRRDPNMLEAVARQELGLIRPGETLITLRDRPKH